MSETKPTAGAMRAANFLIVRVDTDFQAAELAEVLDRETGLSELLEAAKEVREKYWGTSTGLQEAIERLDSAITKAGGWQ